MIGKVPGIREQVQVSDTHFIIIRIEMVKMDEATKGVSIDREDVLQMPIPRTVKIRDEDIEENPAKEIEKEW